MKPNVWEIRTCDGLSILISFSVPYKEGAVMTYWLLEEACRRQQPVREGGPVLRL